MEKNLSHLIFILDRSGSMGGVEDETIKGLLNNKQKWTEN